MPFLNSCPLRIFLFLCIFLSCGMSISAKSTDSGIINEKVLIVSSDNASNLWNQELMAGLRDSLGRTGRSLAVDNLDMNIAGAPELRPCMREIELLRERLKKLHYDLIIVSGNAAADLFFDKRIEVPPNTPFLFFNYQCFKLNGRKQLPGMTGFFMPESSSGNIRMGMKLFPKTEKIAVILDGGVYGDSIEKCVRDEKWPENGPEIVFISGRNYSTTEMLRKVASLPKNSFLVMNRWQSTKEPEGSRPEKILPQIQEHYSGPILGTLTFQLQFGALGGIMSDGFQQGQQVGQLAGRILNGEKPESIPVSEAASRLIYSYPQLEKFHIPQRMLPEDAEIQGKPKEWYEAYYREIMWGGLCLFLLLAVSLAWLFYFIRQWRRLNAIFKALPVNIAVGDLHGKLLFSRLHLPGEAKEPRCVKDIPGVDTDQCLETGFRVIRTGQKEIFRFVAHGRMRQATILPLDKKLFRRDALLWLSVDIDDISSLAERFRLTLDSIGDAVISTDADGIIQNANPVAAKLCGVGVEEMTGRSVDDILNLRSYLTGEPVESPIRVALRENRIVELANHTDLIAADGTRRHVADSAAPIRNARNEVVGAVIVFRDVTEDYRKRDLLRDVSNSLEYASELTRSAAFRMNIKSRETTGSKLLPEIWKMRDGKLLSREEFVYADDLPEFIRTTEKLYRGECEIATWIYRSECFGEMRYYQMRGSVDRSNPNDPYLIGVMQDITEITVNAEKLRESQGLWETVINSLPAMFFAKDADNEFRYVLCNQAYADFLKRPLTDILGKNDAELGYGPEETAHFLQMDKDAMETPGGSVFEETISDGMGKTFHMHITKKPFVGVGGRRLLLAVQNDVSRLKKLLLGEKFNSELLVHMLNADSFDQFADFMADRVKQQLKGDRIMLATCNADGWLRLTKEWYSEGNCSLRECGIEKHYELWDKHIQLMHDNQVLKISDIDTNKITDSLKHTAQYRSKSLIVTPVFVENKLWGALFVSYLTRHEFTDFDENIMRTCTGLLSLALSREKQAQALNLYQREMQLILDNINIPLSLHSADGKLLHVNTAVCRMTELTSEELLNSPESEVFYRGIKPPSDTPLKLVMGGMESAEKTVEIGDRQYIIRADAVRDDNGKLINIVKSAIDMTEFNEMVSCEQIISGILSQIVLESSFEKNLKSVFELLSRNVYCDRITFSIYDPDSGSGVLSDSWMRSEEITPISQRQLDILYRVCGENFRNRRLVCVDDTAHSDFAPYCKNNSWLSIIAAPIFIKNELHALIAVSSLKRPHRFSDMEKKLMRSMANIIALAQIRDRQSRVIAQADYEKQMILNNIDIPIWLYDGKGRFLRANTAVGKLAGLPAGELTPEKDREIFCDGLKQHSRPSDDVIATGAPERREIVWHDRVFDTSAHPVFDEKGKLLYVVKSAVDITEINTLLRDQKMINSCLEKLFQSDDVETAAEALLKIFCEYFKATRCYILKFDLKRWKTTLFAEYASPGVRRMFEKNVEYPLSPADPWLEAFKRRKVTHHPDMRSAESRKFVGEWSAGYVDEFNMRSLFVSPIYVRGKLWGDIGIIYEDTPCGKFSSREEDLLNSTAHLIEIILERKESHDLLIRALEEARAAERAKSYFIASVSHEIRTPLNSVIGFSDLLRNDNTVLTAEQKEYLDNIVYSGNALLQLVNDVLDLSKLEADQMEIVTSPVDFKELGHEVMKVFAFRALDRNLTLNTNIPDLPELELDHQRVRQILFNLIGNAVKFTERGSITLSAEFRPVSGECGTLEFTVTDTGPGIAEEDRHRLMEPFVQLRRLRGTNTTNNGTGLGLAISKRMAEKMGGRIWLQSELDKGSTFGVTLDNVKYRSLRTSVPEPHGETPPSEDAYLQKLSVLVVDDVSLNLRVLVAMCRKLGIRHIVQAESGARALEELEKQKFDFVLTDLWMPEIDGQELFRRIRADKRFDGVLVVAVTADSEARGNCDFDAVLLKPVTQEGLRGVFTKARLNDMNPEFSSNSDLSGGGK